MHNYECVCTYITNVDEQLLWDDGPYIQNIRDRRKKKNTPNMAEIVEKKNTNTNNITIST